MLLCYLSEFPMSKSIFSRLPLLVLTLLLSALVIYLSWPAPEAERKQHKRVVAVAVEQVVETEFKEIIEAIGTSTSAEQVTITSKYADIVESVNFIDGQQVEKGQILVTLNSDEEQAKVSELQANLAESVAQYERFQDLLKNRATSKSVVDQKEAQVKAIAAQLKSASVKLDYLTIRAPFNGVLGFKQISAGAYVKAGDSITTIDDLSVIKVDFAVPERYLARLSAGQKVVASTVAYQDEQFSGEVISIASRLDSATRTIQVRAAIDNSAQKLRPGMLIKIQLERANMLALQVPESSVIPIENSHFVYVVENEKAVKKRIIIGKRQPGKVEVLEGLTEGEQVVVAGALKLRPGSNVRIIDEEPVAVAESK